MKRIIFFLTIVIIVSSCQNEIKEEKKEYRKEYVIDNLELLNPGEKDSLSNLLLNFDKKTSVEVVYYIADSLYGMSVNSYSQKVFDSLKIGKKHFNNGVLLLLAPNQGKVQFMTGYGVEWKLTDSIAEDIIANMLPFFKTGNYNKGASIGLNKVINYLEDIDWKIYYYSLNELKDDLNNAKNKLAVIELQRIVLPDSLPYSSNVNYGYIETKDGRLELVYTNHMDKLITEINSKPEKILVRVSETNPLEVQLIGSYTKD